MTEPALIYVFCSSCRSGRSFGGGGDHSLVAIAEDGTFLAFHISSSHDWAQHDMGFSSEWKHRSYSEHYPDGWRLVWVPDTAQGKHAGFDAAVERAERSGAV